MKLLKNICANTFLFGFLFCGCSESGREKSDLIMLDLEQQKNKAVSLNADKLIGSMNYVPLETVDSSIMSGNYIIRQRKGFFLVNDNNAENNKLMLFDGQGKYQGQISRQGQGPQEYIRINDFDMDDNYIYLFNKHQKKILVYDYDRRYVREIIVKPKNISGIKKVSTGFVCYRELIFEPDNYKKSAPDLVLADEHGEEINVLHYRTVNLEGMPPFIYSGLVKKYDDRVYFLPALHDTLFVFDGASLRPAIVLNRGQQALYFQDVHDREKRRAASAGVLINDFLVSDKWVILRGVCQGKTVMFMYSKASSELQNVEKIINNIDDSYNMQFPHELSDNALLDLKWFAEMKEENKIPKSLHNTGLKEDDNPVVRISALK